MNIEELLQHRPFVRALARRLVRDQARADDLEQQTWLTAIEKPPVHRGALRAWLHAVVRNLARTQNRAEFRRHKHEGSQPGGKGLPTPEEALVKAEWHRRLVEAVMTLDEPYRTTVLLRYFEDLDSKQIAAIQDVPSATVRTRLRRGLAKIRVLLEEHDSEDGDPDGHAAWIGGLILLARPPLVAPVPVSSQGDAVGAGSGSRSGSGGVRATRRIGAGSSVVAVMIAAVTVVAIVAVVPSEEDARERRDVRRTTSAERRPENQSVPEIASDVRESGHRVEIIVLKDGVPVEGVAVVAAATEPHAWRETPSGPWEVLRRGVTDENGALCLKGLPDGYVRIAAWTPGSARTVAYVHLPIAFSAAQVLDLQPEAKTAIRAIDRIALGPVPNARAKILFADRDPAPMSFRADDSGVVRLRGFSRRDDPPIQVEASGYAATRSAVHAGTVSLVPLTRTARWRIVGSPPPTGSTVSIHRPFDDVIERVVDITGAELVLNGLPEGVWPERWATTSDGRVATLEIESDSVRFERLETIDVNLTDENGRAVFDVLLRLEDASTGQERMVCRTDGRGHARFLIPRGSQLRIAMQGRGQQRWKTLRDADAAHIDIRIPVARRVRIKGALPSLFVLTVDGHRREPAVLPDGSVELLLRPDSGHTVSGHAEARIDFLARGFRVETRILDFAEGDVTWNLELTPASTLRFRPFGRPGDLVLADPLTGEIRRRGAWRYRLTAGPDGVVRDSMIPEGRHVVLDLLRDIKSAPFDSPRGGADLTIDFDLSQRTPARLEGVVVAHAGVPLDRSVVEIVPGGIVEVGTDGSFRFVDPGIRPFVVRVRHTAIGETRTVSVNDPSEPNGEPVVVALTTFATGRWSITGPPAPSIGTSPRVRAGSLVVNAVRSGNELTFGKLPPGPTDLWVDVPGAVPVWLRSVNLHEGDNTLGSLVLRRGGSFRVRFRQEPGTSAPSVIVSLQSETKPVYRRSARDEHAVTGLGAGTFRVAVWDRFTGLRVYVGAVVSDGKSEFTLELEH